MNHIKYACYRFSFWLSWFSVIIGIIAIVPFFDNCSIVIPIIIVLLCFFLAFSIPLFESFVKNVYHISTIGKSSVSLRFGSLFEQECFVVTTNRYFDVDSDDIYISKESLLAEFVEKFYPNNVDYLKNEIKSKLKTNKNKIKSQQYGKTIQIKNQQKIIYLMAFTDRNKDEQPDDFYIKAISRFIKEISTANHGKTISIPLLGSNNSLSNSGFSDDSIALESIITMIKQFEIENQRSELKIQIVILPEKRAKIIDTIAKLTK